ncbi:MAG: hypothetical protein JJU00_12800 [Opitutales bacterium]|nr:hypothetical protein [Opitutales bacterium]
MKSIKALLLLSFGAASVLTLAAEEVIQIHPRFDSGRLRTNTLLDGQSFNQWTNGTGFNWANNVGVNPQGIWYSFIRFAGPRAEGDTLFGAELADLHGMLDAAGSVTLRGDVLWHERDADFPVDPGVTVSVWLVPGMTIPEGQFPTFANTWPWNYPDSVKVTSFAPEETTPLRANFNAAEADPVTERSQMAYNLRIDLTAAIHAAIDAGTMTATTPWGIVFFPESMEDQRDVANNPAWLTREGTVLSGAYWEVVIQEGDPGDPVDPDPDTWAGFEIEESGWVDTGDFLGWIHPMGDFVYVLSLEGWMYLPAAHVETDGAWAFVIR